MEDEETLTISIKAYEAQLQEIENAILLTDGSDRDDLIKVREDLNEIINLTKNNLLLLKKANLFKEVDRLQPAASTATHSASADEGNIYKTSSCDVIQNDSKWVDALESLKGNACQAPLNYEWGQISYHNAIILDIDCNQNASTIDDLKVQVMFCNPVFESMKPCQHYLEGKCKFLDNCRYSHGHTVPFGQLREFVEPNYSLLKLNARCLAKFKDGLWYPAIVESINGETNEITVVYEKYDTVATLPLEELFPQDDDDSCSSSSDDVSVMPDDEESLVFSAWAPNLPLPSFADWERHTKGIGSKLMAKMGYIAGQGLGKNGEGRVNPVEAVVFPPGKSLDAIMELREKNASKDLIKQEKKIKLKKKKQEKLIASGYWKKDKSSIIDIVNNILSNSSRKQLEKVETAKEIPKLNSASNKTINEQTLQIADKLKRAKLDVDKLKLALLRNERDKLIYSQIKQKIAERENEITQLTKLEKNLTKEQLTRKSDKKLAIF